MRPLVTASIALVLVVLGVVTGGAAFAAPDPDGSPRPVLHGDFPDPAVVDTPRGLVAYATGDRVPHAVSRTDRGPWERGAPLLRRPSWAAPGGIWAVDVTRARGRWVLYHATPVRGLGEQGRCIGVAVSRDARGPFVPVGDGPLVCPAYARAPAAQDRLLPRDRTLPRAGVIDPSFHRDATGAHLLYKTDRRPSTIRVVPLTDDGLRVRPGATSLEILRSDDVVENPALARRPEGYTLLVSVGDYTRCTYRTSYYRSATLLPWRTVDAGRLLDRASTGLCGPGGADLLDPTAARSRLFLHGWTCDRVPRPCRGPANWDERRRDRPVRSMYAATLAWRGGVPRLVRWLAPR